MLVIILKTKVSQKMVNFNYYYKFNLKNSESKCQKVFVIINKSLLLTNFILNDYPKRLLSLFSNILLQVKIEVKMKIYN